MNQDESKIKKEPPSPLEMRLDSMLKEYPVGCSTQAGITYDKLGPLTVEYFREVAPEDAPVEVDGWESRFHEWTNPWGDTCQGQIGKSGKNPRHGIVRKIDRKDGSVWEGQYSEDKLHGFMRMINADGSYHFAMYKDGVLNGDYKCF